VSCTTIPLGATTTPESWMGSPKVNLFSRQWFSKVNNHVLRRFPWTWTPSCALAWNPAPTTATSRASARPIVDTRSHSHSISLTLPHCHCHSLSQSTSLSIAHSLIHSLVGRERSASAYLQSRPARVYLCRMRSTAVCLTLVHRLFSSQQIGVNSTDF